MCLFVIVDEILKAFRHTKYIIFIQKIAENPQYGNYFALKC